MLTTIIALAISTAIRYCGTTFSYTSVAILLNYMAPLHIVGMANGLAQSIVSLARFIGPVSPSLPMNDISCLKSVFRFLVVICG